jgi:hypothetical protein
MAPLSREEISDLLASAGDRRLAEDMRALRQPFAEPDLDSYIDFATQANAFAGHPRKPFRPIVDADCRI